TVLEEAGELIHALQLFTSLRADLDGETGRLRAPDVPESPGGDVLVEQEVRSAEAQYDHSDRYPRPRERSADEPAIQADDPRVGGHGRQQRRTVCRVPGRGAAVAVRLHAAE